MFKQEVDKLGIGLARSLSATRHINIPKSVQRIPELISSTYNDLKVNKPGTVLSNLTG